MTKSNRKVSGGALIPHCCGSDTWHKSEDCPLKKDYWTETDYIEDKFRDVFDAIEEEFLKMFKNADKDTKSKIYAVVRYNLGQHIREIFLADKTQHEKEMHTYIVLFEDSNKLIEKLKKEISELKEENKRKGEVNLGLNGENMMLVRKCTDREKEIKSSNDAWGRSELFVKHIENHLKEMGYPTIAKAMCKICRKDIDKIFDEERKTKGDD